MRVAWRTLFCGIMIGTFAGSLITNMSAMHRAGRVSKQVSATVSNSFAATQALTIAAAPAAAAPDVVRRGPGLLSAKIRSQTIDAAPITTSVDAIPVWIWMDYKDAALPGFIEMNLRALLRNAPSPDFVLRFVDKSNIKSFVPDMPQEFDQLPYAAATSDLIRTALIANHGGVYLDTDFLVARPMHEFTDWLQTHDFVSYESHGQQCAVGSFSSNMIAGVKGNALSRISWDNIKTALRRKCMHADGTPEQGVCCYTPDGKPRKCHIPWGGVGERTSHPVLKELITAATAGQGENFKMHCYNSMDQSFVPPISNSNGMEKADKLDSGRICWTLMNGTKCTREGDDLTCYGPGNTWKASSPNYFNRLAYHLFSSIMGNDENRAYSPAELLNGNWAISELYRTAFAGEPPPRLAVASLTPLLGFPDQEPLAGVPSRPASSFLSAGAIAAAAHLSSPTTDPFAAGFAATGGLTPDTDTAGMCTTALASWLGKPVDPADDFQCRPLNLTFVHIPKSAGTTIERIGKKLPAAGGTGVVWGHDYDEKRWNILKALDISDPVKARSYPVVATTHPNINACSRGCSCHKGCCWWHIPPKLLVDWRPYYDAPLRFCVVRNPFARLLSQYSYMGNYECPRTPEQLQKRSDYINKHVDRFYNKNETSVSDCHFIPQADYVANAVDNKFMKRLWGSEHSSGEALDLLGSLQYSDDADAKSCNVVARFEHLAPDLDAVSTWSGVNVRTKWQKPSTEKCTDTSISEETAELIRFVYGEDFDRFGYDLDWPTY